MWITNNNDHFLCIQKAAEFNHLNWAAFWTVINDFNWAG